MIAPLLAALFVVVGLVIMFNGERIERWIQRRNRARLDAYVASCEAHRAPDTFPIEWVNNANR